MAANEPAGKKTLASAGPLNPEVAVAIGLAWNISDLYFHKLPKAVKLLKAADAAGWDTGLPELSDLPEWERASQTASRISAQLKELSLDPPIRFDVEIAEAKIDDQILRTGVFELHLNLFRGLASGDPKLHLAYRLGIALAHTVMAVRKRAGGSLTEELDRNRVATLLLWLAQLERSLPPHSSDAVRYSLSKWRDWAAGSTQSAQTDRAVAALGRQGRLWRDLLTGERIAADLLQPVDYVRAGTQMARRIGGVLMRFMASGIGIAVLVLILLLLLAGLWLLGTGVDTTKIVAIAIAFGAPLGVTAASAQATIKRTVDSLQTPLWTAVMGQVIGEAAYLDPNGRMPTRQAWWQRIGLPLGLNRPSDEPDPDDQTSNADSPAVSPGEASPKQETRR